jgi:hypothetical protein
MTFNPKSGDLMPQKPKRRPPDPRTPEEALRDLALLLDPPPPADTLRYRLWLKRRKGVADGEPRAL